MEQQRRDDGDPHPWQAIDLDVYERHMRDDTVGQLQRLHQITGEQLASHRSRRVGVLGVAGGNGLDLIDLETTDRVIGFDVNPDYLAVCEERHRRRLGDRLHLVEMSVDRWSRIEPVDLLIANLIVEYIGLDEFALFVTRNQSAIGVLSAVTQSNRSVGPVSETELSSAFDGLRAVASEVDAMLFADQMSARGFAPIWFEEYALPNGKALIRQDFAVGTGVFPAGRPAGE